MRRKKIKGCHKNYSIRLVDIKIHSITVLDQSNCKQSEQQRENQQMNQNKYSSRRILKY